MRRLGFVVALVLALTAGASFAAAAGAATTFHVNSVDDPGTGGCDGVECTLREAIAAANADATPDTIDFSAVASASGDIVLLTPLPAVSNPVLIDGTTHPDFAEDFPGVRLDGGTLASGAGLLLSGGGITVKGVAIDGFTGNGITIDTAGGNVLQGNVIGESVPVTGAGISIASGGNTIGGAAAGDGNTIHAEGDGVAVLGGTGNQIRGNTVRRGRRPRDRSRRRRPHGERRARRRRRRQQPPELPDAHVDVRRPRERDVRRDAELRGEHAVHARLLRGRRVRRRRQRVPRQRDGHDERLRDRKLQPDVHGFPGGESRRGDRHRPGGQHLGAVRRRDREPQRGAPASPPRAARSRSRRRWRSIRRR